MISMEEKKITSGILSSSFIPPESDSLKLSVSNGFFVIHLNGEKAILTRQTRDAIRFFKGINHGFRKKEAGFHEVEEILEEDSSVLGWTMYFRIHNSCHCDLVQAVRESISPTQHLFGLCSSIFCQHKLSSSLYVFNVIDRCDQLPEFPKISILGSEHILDHDEYKELFGDYVDEHGINFRDDSCSRARHDHQSQPVPQVHVDMPKFYDHVDAILEKHDNYQNPLAFYGHYQAKELLDHLDNVLNMDVQDEYNHRVKQMSTSYEKYDSMKIIYGTLTAVAGQVVGGLAANRLSSSSTGSSCLGPAVELSTLLGLTIAMAGMILRGKRKRRALSALMIKIGAMTIASTIIFSMGSHLPQGIAWIVGPVAFLIMAVAAASA